MFLQQVRSRFSSKRRGIRKWLFASEMNDKFTPEIAEAMRERKRLDPELARTEIRFHPECPPQEAHIRCANMF